MGEVYKAKDSRLDRTVAIKVLPTGSTANQDLRQRFEREAKAVSSLNHPNICILYDVGHQDGIDYLVMEHIEGETLSVRLEKGPLPTADLLRYATQIADALDKAHRQGLVHRDLKPGNIMLTKSGAKLLDFGLAKLQESGGVVQGVAGLTRTTPLTGSGTIIGTLQYMAPEQLEGKEADARSDIFAFGSILYEMATGKHAFEGKSQASLIAAILKENPRSIAELQPLSPPMLERVIRQCMEKEPDDRWNSAGDVKRALQWISEGGSQVGLPVAVSARRRVREWLGWAAAVTIAATAMMYVRCQDAPSIPVLRTMIPAPADAVYLFGGDNAGPPVVSPDGMRIAFVAVSAGGSQVWVRDLADLSSHALPGTEGGRFPFWSPNSSSIGFYAAKKLKRIDIATGQVLTLCAVEPGAKGGSWSEEDAIVFSPNYQDGLFAIPASGGTPTSVIHLDSAQHTTHRWPFVLPDGNHFLYFAGDHRAPVGPHNGIWFASLDGSENHLVLESLTDAAYADGHLFFVRDSVIFVQPFDPVSGRLKGDLIPTREKVQVDYTTWKANFAVSQAGLLVYQLVGGLQGCQLLVVDRSGKTLRTLGSRGNIRNIYFSRSASVVAFSAQEIPTTDIYYHDLKRDIRTRLTLSPEDDDGPVLSPSGDRVAFSATRGAAASQKSRICLLDVTGAGDEQQLTSDSTVDFWPFDWSPDGRYLLCGVRDYQMRSSPTLYLLPIDGNSPAIPILSGRDSVKSARLSPDGRWIALASIVEGSQQVFVMQCPIAGGKSTTQVGPAVGRWQISTAGGRCPRWRADGRELYYIREDGMAMAVEVGADGSEFQVGPETELYRAWFRKDFECWDPSPDGQYFIVNALSGEGSTPIVVVQNWAEGLTR
jgi:Tol biopolymer transport system component